MRDMRVLDVQAMASTYHGVEGHVGRTPLIRLRRLSELTVLAEFLYADRKLLTPETIACIKTRFHLPEDRT